MKEMNRAIAKLVLRSTRSSLTAPEYRHYTCFESAVLYPHQILCLYCYQFSYLLPGFMVKTMSSYFDLWDIKFCLQKKNLVFVLPDPQKEINCTLNGVKQLKGSTLCPTSLVLFYLYGKSLDENGQDFLDRQ